MTKLISIRLHEKMLVEIERERRRAGITRSAAITEALRLWIADKRYQDAIRLDQEGYKRQPVSEDEFQSLLGAQVWPK